jgi:hypothetical protein
MLVRVMEALLANFVSPISVERCWEEYLGNRMAPDLRLTEVHVSRLAIEDRVQTFTRLSRSFSGADQAPDARGWHRLRPGKPPGVALLCELSNHLHGGALLLPLDRHGKTGYGSIARCDAGGVTPTLG